ncbi:MAG TPA: response regulator [Pyrinomonadaceae bacterium]|jgi:CheY-like chemotaxis protein|nr:response regulator [Pyrinomonadaceae bacterium]
MAHTILLVEDYDDAREFMHFMLEFYGYEVIEATDGREAVECTKNEHPDLILMDISLPEMDGIAATKQIRQLEEGGNVPVVAITAHTNCLQQALKAGCNEVLFKPVEPEYLKKVIASYL